MMYDNASDFWDGIENLHEFSSSGNLSRTQNHIVLSRWLMSIAMLLVTMRSNKPRLYAQCPHHPKLKSSRLLILTTAHSQDCSADEMKKNCCNTLA